MKLNIQRDFCKIYWLGNEGPNEKRKEEIGEAETDLPRGPSAQS